MSTPVFAGVLPDEVEYVRRSQALVLPPVQMPITADEGPRCLSAPAATQRFVVRPVAAAGAPFRERLLVEARPRLADIAGGGVERHPLRRFR